MLGLCAGSVAPAARGAAGYPGAKRFGSACKRAVLTRSGPNEECRVPTSNCIEEPTSESCLDEGPVTVQDDLTSLLEVCPEDVREVLINHPDRGNLLEIVLDLGRKPEARFLGKTASISLREEEISLEDLQLAEESLGEFGGDNRAGITGTLHRISCLRNRRGGIVGLTCRVGRAVTGHVDMIRDLLDGDKSILFLGRPGVGKTTVIREMARVLADECHKRVVIVDTSNEIGGDGDVPHPAIGGARRMQVMDPSVQHRTMVEAVENHMPQVIIVDEIGTEAETQACRTIAERGVQLIGTAHGQVLQNLIKNPTLTDLIGGVESVTLGDEEARTRGSQKTVLERKAPPTFPVIIEMRERSLWVEHHVESSVDALLKFQRPMVVERTRDSEHEVVITRREYDLDAEIGGASRMQSEGPARRGGGAFHSSGGGSAADPYQWAQRLDSMPDKDADALQNLALMGSMDMMEADMLLGNGNGNGNGRRKSKKRGTAR